MTDFFLVLLIFTQIPVMLIFASRVMCGQTTFTSFRKNPEWIVTHPEFNRHRLFTRIWLGFCYLLAALTFIAAVKFTLITPMASPSDLIDYLLVLPMVAWGMGFMIYWAVFYFGVVKKIPAPAKREASLDSRQLSTYVSLWVVYLGYGLLGLILIVYIGGWMSGAVGSEPAIRMFIAYSLALIAITFGLLLTLRRKHTEGEQVFGIGGRKAEVMINIGTLYLCVFAGLYRILNDFFSITPFSSDGFAVVIFSVIQVFFVWVLLHPKVRSLHREYRETYLLGG